MLQILVSIGWFSFSDLDILLHRLIHSGQLLICMAGPLTMGGAPLLSAIWFPVHQRTTATAIGVLSGTLGVAVSFIIGNLIGVLQSSATFFQPVTKLRLLL